MLLTAPANLNQARRPDSRTSWCEFRACPSSTRHGFTAAVQIILAIIILILSTGAVRAATQTQLQTQTPESSKPQSVKNLRFQEFFKLPVGPRGLEISDTLGSANGMPVSLIGYMVRQEGHAAGQFLLSPRPVQMSEVADGDADDLPVTAVLVFLDPTQKDWTVVHNRRPVLLNGVLNVGRREEADGRVSWIRLQLGPEATANAHVLTRISPSRNAQPGHE